MVPAPGGADRPGKVSHNPAIKLLTNDNLLS
jgi:hypothetical protein